MMLRIRTWLANWLRPQAQIDPAQLTTLPSDGELSGALAGAVLADLIRERRAERRWRAIRRTGIAILFVGGLLFYGYTYLSATGSSGLFERAPEQGSLGVIRVSGPIGADRAASARNLIPQLRRAFESDRIRAVVIQIDSPGGAPLEAERINTFVREIRITHPKPVYAVIENIGASAAYMIAVQADEIWAGRYSLVGSIGAMLGSWDVHRVLERVDVERRVFASGELKTMLDPFLPTTDEAQGKAQSMVDAVGRMFVDEVRAARGARLVASSIDSGEVWNGSEAKALGLIDEIGTLEALQAKLDDAPIRVFERSGPFGFSRAVTEWSAIIARDAVESVLEQPMRLQ